MFPDGRTFLNLNCFQDNSDAGEEIERREEEGDSGQEIHSNLGKHQL